MIAISLMPNKNSILMLTTRCRRVRVLPIGIKFVVVLALLTAGTYSHRAWVRSWVTTYSRQCREARDQGRWNDLQRLGEQWTAWDQHSTDAWLFRADAAQRQGDFASAAEFLERIPETDPKALPVLVSLSTLQFGSLNRPLDGVRTCERMLRIDSRTTAAHHQLIEFYAMSLQRRKLNFHIRFAIECSREPPTAYVYLFLIDTMRLANGVESNEKWLEQYPGEEVFLVARLLQMPEPESGVRTEDGNDKYTQVDSLFARFPKNLELLAYKIDLGIRKGNVEEVLELLRQLPTDADEDCRFWRAKGWLHLSRDEIVLAKRALQKAIELYPLDWNARNWMADALRREGNRADAEPLQTIVQAARRLRTQITSNPATDDIPTEILMELFEFAHQCGDGQVADALRWRLGKN